MVGKKHGNFVVKYDRKLLTGRPKRARKIRM
jgi:hypothetical protein